jgi:hypothetical protein
MKTLISQFSALVILLSISLTSCTKDNRPAEISTDTQEMIFSKDQNIRYFGITNTGNTTMDFQITPENDLISVFPSNGVLGFNQVAKIEVTTHADNLGYGVHQTSLLINSNGGVRVINIQIIKSLPNPSALWWDIDYIKIPAAESRDYITLRNDGELDLSYELSGSESWMSFSQSSGTLAAGASQVIWVNVDRTGLANNLYEGEVNISSNGGNATLKVDMEVGVYSVSFFNPTYTVIYINVPGQGSKSIDVLDRVSYIFPSNPASLYYTATTEGETVGGVVLGLTLNWNETLNLSSEVSPIFNLDISKDYFFMSAKNYGTHNLDRWSINNGTIYQFDEDVTIPNDGYEYYFGYYDALDNTKIYARIVGTSYDAVWKNGTEFNFPWTLNQSILLESDAKSSSLKSTRDDAAFSELQPTMKPGQNQRMTIRTRNHQSLVNQKTSPIN